MFADTPPPLYPDAACDVALSLTSPAWSHEDAFADFARVVVFGEPRAGLRLRSRVRHRLRLVAPVPGRGWTWIRARHKGVIVTLG